MRIRALLAGVLLIALLASPLRCQDAPSRIAGEAVPAAEWERTSPESVGFSSAKLEVVRAWLKTQDTGSMLIVVQGRVIFSYGDLSHTSKVASVRKSILGMLYGKYVLTGKIDLDKSVVQLGLDDKTPFLLIEAKATLVQLLASRSGIYLPGGNAHPENLSPWDQARYMPPRGSEYPGAHYVYNNWDFNAAGTAFEKLTGTDIYKALQTDLAMPLGLQDYDLSKQKKDFSPDSVHPGYPMYLSTRDMARLGLLMLDSGSWNGKEIIPPDWVRYMTSLLTPFRDINPSSLRNYGEPGRWGYGLLWWVWDQPFYPGNTWDGFLQGAYTAAGSGGTYITVLPGMDMVVVHQVDIDKNARASVTPSSYMAILSMIGNAQCADACK